MTDAQQWTQLPEQIQKTAELLAPLAAVLKQAVATCFTTSSVGIHVSHDSILLTPAANITDALIKTAADDLWQVSDAVREAVDVYPVICGVDELPDTAIKVAYSPTLRGLLETTNFLPGHYAGTGIPNHPGFVSSALTSGALGAGLGYTAGWLGEKMLPDQWEKGKLRRTLATLGGAVGVAPTALMGAVNLADHRKLTDWSLLDQPAGGEPQMIPDTPGKQVQASDQFTAQIERMRNIKLANDFDTMGEETGRRRLGPSDVNIDAMGRTLWQAGADPAVAGITMAALHTASRMPGGDKPGFVTPAQMGRLAMGMGGGYLSGAMVGAALGVLAGMPEDSQKRLAQTGEYLGLVKELLPHLFSGDGDGG